MNAMPSGWANAMLGELVQPVRGLTYKKDQARASGDDGLAPLLRATNVQDGELLLDREVLYIPASLVRDDQWLQPGDIVVASSSGSSSVVGKSAPVRRPWHGTFGAFCTVLRPSKALDAAYIAHFLSSPAVRNRWSRLAAGTNINNLKKAHIAETPVPVPPLNEQWRIVAAIEEQFSRLDAADASLRLAKQRLDRMTPIVLTSALRAAGSMVRLDEVAEVRLGRQRSPRNHFGPNMRPYLRAANVTWDGLALADVKSMNFSPSEAETFQLQDGDVLLAEASGSPDEVGKPAIWRNEIEGCCFQNTLIRVRSQGPLPEYLRLVFLREALTGKFAAAAPGVGIHHLGSTRLARWAIPLPALERQRQVVDEVEQRLSIIEAMKRQVDLAVRRSAALRGAVLQEASLGRLVPQDPADESASVLLERISSARPAASNASSQKSKLSV